MRVFHGEGEKRLMMLGRKESIRFLRGMLWHGMKCTAKHLSGNRERERERGAKRCIFGIFLFWAFPWKESRTGGSSDDGIALSALGVLSVDFLLFWEVRRDTLRF